MTAVKINRYPLKIDGQVVQIGSANELAIALDVLQGQYDEAALHQLQEHLAEITAHASGFMTLLRSLSVENQLFLIQAIGPGLVQVIQNARHLRDILAIASEASVEHAILSTLGSSGLMQLIQTGEELAEVLEWVYGEEDTLVLNLLGEKYLCRLCRHADSLSAVLHNIDDTLQAKLLEQLGWPFILNLVQDGRDLAYLLRALPPQNSAVLLQHFTGPHLVELIGNNDDWAYLYQRLETAEADLLLELLNYGAQ